MGKIVSSPIIVIEWLPQSRVIIGRAADRLARGAGQMIVYPKIKPALEDLKKIVSSGGDIALVISDLYLNDSVNIFSLIREMEADPVFWNIPLLAYTNLASLNIFNWVRKDIIHLPFRMIPKTIDEGSIVRACTSLMQFKSEHLSYLELEKRIDAMVEKGDVALAPEIIGMLEKGAMEYPNVLHRAKAEYLKGMSLYGIWKRRVEAGEGAGSAEAEIRKKALAYFLSAHKLYPKHWKLLFALYSWYLDDKNPDAARVYLEELVKLFPEHSEYRLLLGQLQEGKGELTEANRSYYLAGKNIENEGIGNFDEKFVMSVVDASLNLAKRTLSGLNRTKIDSRGFGKETAEYESMKILQKNNALVRGALLRMAEINDKDPELFNKIGITYRRIGQYRLALEMYRRALNRESGNSRIRINYAAALALTGEWQRAEEEIRIAGEKDETGEDAETVRMLSEIIASREGEKLEKILV
ncbi:MAG: tetratricopeptide repeat protein [Nitrospinota bacterium]|nr:tetratricopeptide repeat protein [Nitrospinota bacterium]